MPRIQTHTSGALSLECISFPSHIFPFIKTKPRAVGETPNLEISKWHVVGGNAAVEQRSALNSTPPLVLNWAHIRLSLSDHK
jgi:hypothetical protein